MGVVLKTSLSDRKMTSRWSIRRAAAYGFVLMILVFGLEIIEIWVGTRKYDPWLNPNIPINNLIGYWGGFFISGPLLFVVIAITRNTVQKK